MTCVETTLPVEKWHPNVRTCVHDVRGRFDHRCRDCDGARAMPEDGISAETVREALLSVGLGAVLFFCALFAPGLLLAAMGVTP